MVWKRPETGGAHLLSIDLICKTIKESLQFFSFFSFLPARDS